MEDEYHMLNAGFDDPTDIHQPRDDEPDNLTTSTMDPTMVDPTAIMTKTRRIQVKLTGEKLMDPNRGLDHLMKIGKSKIRISKRKSAYDNLNGIVQVYQLWAHQLYPKAKFRDFLKLTQQLGKTDRMLRDFRKNVIRKEMGIPIIGDEQEEDKEEENERVDSNVQESTETAGVTVPTTSSSQGNGNDDDTDEEEAEIANRSKKNVFIPEDDSDDDLYSLPANTDSTQNNEQTPSMSNVVNTNTTTDTTSTTTPTTQPTKSAEDAANEELERLEQEELMNMNPPAPTAIFKSNDEFEEDFEDDEEAMEAMREFDM